jgi:GMP synthase PP-ATPase subunit
MNQLEFCTWSDSTCYNDLSYVSYGKKMFCIGLSSGIYSTEDEGEVREWLGTLPALPAINVLNKFKFLKLLGFMNNKEVWHRH